jgi:hypothetical protein
MPEKRTIQGTAEREAIEHLRTALLDGNDWPPALLKAISLWSLPEETFKRARFNYFIGGEAFDWLALAQRLSYEVEGLIPSDELEELLFRGQLPSYFNMEDFKDLLGAEKHRGFLNYFYGVEVESSLLQAVTAEIEKRFYASGRRYHVDHSDESHFRIYRTTMTELLESYREERSLPEIDSFTLTEQKEFTYWLFKVRLKVSDKAKIASDTRKGLAFLQERSQERSRDLEDLSVLAS